VVRTPHRAYTSLFRHVEVRLRGMGRRWRKWWPSSWYWSLFILIGILSVSWYDQYQSAENAREKVAELISQVETGRLGRAELESRVAREREVSLKLKQEHVDLKANLKEALENLQAERQS